MLIRNGNNNFSREWTQHAIKDGKGPVKGAEASKGRISKDKGKSAGFGKKE